MRIRTNLVAAAVAVGVLATAGTASAATTTVNLLNTGASFGVTSLTTNDGGSGLNAAVTVVNTARGQNLGNVLGTSTQNMSIECVGATTATVGTVVRSCYLQGLGAQGGTYSVGSAVSKPGPGDARAGAVLTVPSQPYRACIQTRGLLLDGNVFDSPTVCSQ